MPRFGLDPIATGTDDVDLVDIPTLDVLGATAGQTFRTNPTVGAYQVHQLDEATHGRAPSARFQSKAGDRYLTTKAAEPNLPADAARARIAAAGLEGHLTVPTNGMPAPALDMLIDRKRAELRSAFLADRYRGGIAGGAAQLGTALAVSLADPVNIGSAFIPVYGEARYAALLERAGASLLRRGAARAGVGTLEGVVGTAMLEPLIYTSQRQLQADYDAVDSLMNVGFGGLFGGVLHPSAGGVADLFARRAGVGAWAETYRSDGSRDLPDLPTTFLPGGGTRWVHGDDYARGQFALIEAERLGGDGARFESLDADQVGQSPTASAGAPVLRPDGGVVDGSRRLATLRHAYAAGQGEAYRARLVADAARYGLDPADVATLRQPVLVRVEGAREAGAAAEIGKDNSMPSARALAQAMEATEQAPTRDEFLRLLDQEIGWAERGGKMVREGAIDDDLSHGASYGRAAGDVVGRSSWVAKTGADGRPSAFWATRPDPSLTEAQARAALAKHSNGERLGPREARFLEHAQRVAQGYLDDYLADAAAIVEHAEATAHAERTLELRTRRMEAMLGSQLEQEQAAIAMRLGIAQAVNGEAVDVAAVRHLDGTPEGVERFLEARAQAEAATAARLADEAAANAKAVAGAIDVTDTAKLDADVKALEADIRAQMEAAGDDLAAFDAAMLELDELAAATKIEAKALLGAAMCMERT
jgi:hypothetical protein